MKIDLNHIFDLQIQNQFDQIIQIIKDNNVDKSSLSTNYSQFLIKKHNGNIQRTQFGPLLINRTSFEYYIEFVNKVLLK